MSVPEEGCYDEGYYRDSLHRRHWFRNNAAKHQRRWEEVLRMLAPGHDDVILELGCAAGAHALKLAPLCARVIGVDLSAAGIERARAAAQAAGAANAEFVAGDAASLPWLPDRSIDKIAAIDFFEHVDDATLARILAESKRVLRPGGLIAVFTPCRTHYVERIKANGVLLRQLPGHIAVRDAAQFRALVEAAGLAVHEVRYMASTYPLFGWLDRSLASAPWIGPLFRFRICMTVMRP